MKEKRKDQSGVALLTAMVILIAVSGIVMGLSRDVSQDMNITRNLRLFEESSNWASGAEEVTEDLITMSVDSRGQDEDLSSGYTTTLNTAVYKLTHNGTLYSPDPESSVRANLSRNGKNVAHVDIQYRGVGVDAGGSVLIAFGYEGLGRGMSNSAASLYYSMVSQGTGLNGDGKQKARVGYLYKTIGR